MKHTLSASILSLGFGLLSPALASAQELGSKGQAIFSAERLMGVHATHSSRDNVDPPGGDTQSDWTSISFGWTAQAGTSSFDIPRFGFDYLVIDHLSIGGSLGYASVSLDDPEVDTAIFQLAPRVGYLHSFGKVVAIWPRGGLTYHSASIDPGGSENGWALSIECPFTFSPSEHFAFHAGPSFDIDMFGTYNPDVGDNRDQGFRAFGINGGILGWF